MRPDPGRALQESAIARMDVEARIVECQWLSTRARALPWLRQVLDQLAEAKASGRWAGFERAPSLPLR